MRQHLILEDPQLIDDYARLRLDFRQTSQQLSQLPLDRAQLDQLERLTDSESRLFTLLKAPHRPPNAKTTLAEGYASIAEGAQAMLTATTRLTEREIEHIQQTAAEGSRTWGYLALAAGLIALALAILFAVLIARPIRQLDQAIRQMGSADFTHAIEVNGIRVLNPFITVLFKVNKPALEDKEIHDIMQLIESKPTPITGTANRQR